MNNISLEQNLRLKTVFICLLFLLFFVICCFATPWPIFDYYQGNSLTQPILITACGLSIFGQKVTGGNRSLHLIEFSVGFDHNVITHLATTLKLQKIFSTDLRSVFLIWGNDPNTQNNYSFILWWPSGLHNASLDAEFSVQIFRFYR